MHAFFHTHAGCLDATGKCHAFCQRYTVTDADGSTESFDTCPDPDNHSGPPVRAGTGG